MKSIFDAHLLEWLTNEKVSLFQVLLVKVEQRAKVQVALRILKDAHRASKILGQATKSAGRMPRRQEPMKDGVSTDMPRGVASRR